MATIVVDSAKVIAAAEEVIAQILAKREARDEEKIAQWMQPRRTFWGKIKTRTREEAIEALEGHAGDTLWGGWRSQYAWGDLDKAKSLLHIARHGDPVTLNEDDARVLF